MTKKKFIIKLSMFVLATALAIALGVVLCLAAAFTKNSTALWGGMFSLIVGTIGFVGTRIVVSEGYDQD